MSRSHAAAKLEEGSRTGWLFNYHNTSESIEAEDGKGEATSASAIQLLFLDFDGDVFEVTLKYQPYFLVAAVEGHEREVELGITSTFGGKQVASVQQIDKEDLDLVNHLSGKQRTYLKVYFDSTQDLTAVRSRLEMALKRNKSSAPDSSEFQASSAGFTSSGLLGFDNVQHQPQDALAWMSWIQDIREYDVKYGVRVAIDCKVYVGLWYDINVTHGHTTLERCDDAKYAPAMPRICAFDIETTKAPLKFPQPEVDQIYMISYMVDNRGYLIVNRDIVTADIGSFEYTPKPEYEGFFDTFNEPDEYHTLRRFFDEMKRHKPNVYVTYNGDYFDFPFIHARSTVHGMDMRREIGFAQGAEGATLNMKIPHLDCFYWVKRDSYLPQGSQGLKAVTKYKLGYDPIEVDPEDMLPLAQTNPQRMASYSVSDAVSTYYLYMKYVHPFIFSLCTIIPMQADEVLRRGSGTLCESLLMVQAHAKNVVFPNKQQQVNEKFYNGHLIDSETYIGGRVEALKSGVYRSNIDMHFRMNAGMFQTLMDKLDPMLRFAIEVEGNEKLENVTNYDEVRSEIYSKLADLRDRPDRHETPLIYHLDVGAMYPNIILTNRLQPSSMVTPEICAGCCFDTPNNELKCKRDMSWVWKGEMFTANRHEFTRVKAQLESESFAASAVVKADIAAVQKKTYGNRKGSVLEGTTFDKPKDESWKRKKGGSDKAGGGGYRAMNDRMRQEANAALLKRAGASDDEGGDSSDDENGPKQFHKLQENTQFSMLKKRLAEYSRRAYGKIHETVELRKTNTVCQRENSFYVDTVRLFRDRRYEYKAALKKWKGLLDKATDPVDVKIAKSRCVQMESLQLAHKCILNSFYGYVMRKGSRWGSMEMAGIVTYLGASLIQVARALVQQIGETLELDTDGIWCCLPKSFPENFTFMTKAGKKLGISYPCVMLNKDVQDVYTNHQYQEYKAVGEYGVRSECSIYFEVDGPYLAMILPASREEGKGIKKRYAVFHPDGRLAELKGFELKRRGELMLIKDFQSLVFKRFLDGATLKDAFDAAAVVANSALDLLYNRGEGYDPEEVIEKLTESSNMTRRLSEYPENQKSLALTTARRIAEFLGPQMVKDKGLACHFVISRLPQGRPVTERPIPLTIFKADPSVRIHFLRKWTGDNALPADSHLKDILDWDYYIGRFSGCVQKIITIPAALQGLPNPVPRVPHPEWLHKRVQQQQSRFRQTSITSMLTTKKAVAPVADLEDIAASPVGAVARQTPKKIVKKEDLLSDSDDEKAHQHCDTSDGDEDRDAEARETEKLRDAAEAEERQNLKRVGLRYFTPGNTRPIDQAFFSDPAFPAWHSRARQGWLHRAKLRKEILGNDPSALHRPTDRANQISSAMDSLLVDLKSKALSNPWHILEVRPAHDAVNTVIVFAVVDRTLQHYRVSVPRTITVDATQGSSFKQDAKVLGGKVLPRHKAATRLFEITVGDHNRLTGDEEIDKLRYLNDDVLNVYEANLTSAERMVMQVGSVATVRSNVHVQNLKERNYRQRDLFQLSEFDAASHQGYLGVQQASLGNSVFVYHVGHENRGVLAALHHDAGKGVVVVVQPAAAPHVAFQWPTMVDEALHVVGIPAGTKTLVPTVVFEPDMTEAWRTLSRFIVEMSNATRPILAVVQSSASDEQLLHHLPHLHTLPIMRTAGDAEDAKILGDAFRWSRLLTRRMLQRFYASQLWTDERLQVSRVAGVPLCNLSSDVSVSALDMMYRRALKKRGLILWDQRSLPTNLETPDERPRQVVVESGHYAWCVEFSLSQVDVIAVLFSQVIQECDEPSARVLADRGVTPHFNIMRDMLSELMGQAIAGKKAAATLLLVSFARWLRDSSSAAYEPRLVEMVSGLVHRALTALLLRITKLGGKIVKATGQSLIVATHKLHLKDAVHFSQFVCSSLKDQPLLSHLHLQPLRYWAPLCVMHHHDLAGWHLDAETAARLAHNSEDPSPEQLTEFHSFTFWATFPTQIKDIFLARVRMFFTLVHETKKLVLERLQTDPTVTLASRADRVADQVSASLHTRIEKEFQPLLLDEVSFIMEQKIQLIAGVSHKEQPSGFADTSSAALEYVKALCYLLELVPGTNAAIRKTKNNCLRVIGIGPFAPSGTFRMSTEVLLGVQVLDTRCSFCNEEGLIDLLGNFQTSEDEDLTSKSFRCASCSAVFARDLVEAELVRRLNRLVHAYAEQDYVCSKCKQPSSTVMSQSCCGEYVGKQDAAIRRELLALRGVAAAVGFPFLLETAEFAIATCVS